MLFTQNTFYIIGIMSGTSLDGIDFAYVKFDFKNNKWHFEFLTTDTYAYPKAWEAKLKEAHLLGNEELLSLDEEYTVYLAKQITTFCKQNTVERIDAVCSHGHTIHHKPEEGYTYQIGNRKALATLLDSLVVCDFRKQDVVLGGQGAPLVPMGDLLLFKDFDACLNLGGFANATILNPKKVIAFDICAVNTVLNRLMNRIGKPYDPEGIYARSGKLIAAMQDRLDTIAFYRKEAPKSLGVEWVEATVFPIIEDFSSYPLEAILHTYCHHIGYQIGKYFKKEQKVLVSGGGCLNLFLMDCIKEYTQAAVEIPDLDLIHYKEALIFGLLGVLKIQGKVNCLSSVTGATKDHATGVVFTGQTH